MALTRITALKPAMGAATLFNNVKPALKEKKKKKQAANKKPKTPINQNTPIFRGHPAIMTTCCDSNHVSGMGFETDRSCEES